VSIGKAFGLAFLVMSLMFSTGAFAHVERTIFIEGTLKSFDEKTAIITAGKSSVRVPAAFIKKHRIQTGQYISVAVDVADFLELNKELLAKNGIK
jgi:hypothetical protein